MAWSRHLGGTAAEIVAGLPRAVEVLKASTPKHQHRQIEAAGAAALALVMTLPAEARVSAHLNGDAFETRVIGGPAGNGVGGVSISYTLPTWIPDLDLVPMEAEDIDGQIRKATGNLLDAVKKVAESAPEGGAAAEKIVDAAVEAAAGGDPQERKISIAAALSAVFPNVEAPMILDLLDGMTAEGLAESEKFVEDLRAGLAAARPSCLDAIQEAQDKASK